MKVSNLCIHLQREEAALNKEIETKPIIATEVISALFSGNYEQVSPDTFKIDDKHMMGLTDMMAKDLGVSRS